MANEMEIVGLVIQTSQHEEPEKEVNKKEVGERIKRIRLEMGYTLEEFGKLFNASKVTVFNWEKGRNLPNSYRLTNIAFQGQMSVNELLFGKFCTWEIKETDQSNYFSTSCETEASYWAVDYEYCPHCSKEIQINRSV